MNNILRSINKIKSFKREEEFKKGIGLTDKQKEERESCENSFLTFTEKAWPLIEGNAPFIPGWHAQAICEHLEALYKLEISRLIINLPPRVGKSNICSVLYTAWVWTKEPHLRFLYSSYAHSLSRRDSSRCRRLIQSDWYQGYWGNTFSLMGDVNSKIRFENNHNGYRLVSSVGGSNTGEGGHFEIEDDPNNIKEIFSEVIRNETNEWHNFVMSSRYSGTITQFRRLVVQQRTHEMDVTGNILAKDDARWIHLRLPMEFESQYKCITVPLKNTNGRKWQDPRKEEGELLWPTGFPANDLILFKEKEFHNSAQRIAGQLQQRPYPLGGGILKEEWFKAWKEKDLPEFEYILQSWDTAFTDNPTSSYSVCTTWGIFKDRGGINNIMLISLFKARLLYPDLRKMATRLARNYYDTWIEEIRIGNNPPDLVLIEEKSSGYGLLADLMRTNIPVMKFDPTKYGTKVARCQRVSHLIENGLVWLPTEYPKHEFYTADSEMFIEAAISFSEDNIKKNSNDIIDSMSQAFIRLTSTGWLLNKEDPINDTEEQWKKERRRYY